MRDRERIGVEMKRKKKEETSQDIHHNFLKYHDNAATD